MSVHVCISAYAIKTRDLFYLSRKCTVCLNFLSNHGPTEH